MATLTNVNLNARSMNGISVINADEIYGSTINASDTITINGNSLSTNFMDLTTNQTSNNAQKTFYLNYSSPTITNQYMRDFSNNGFAVPAVEGYTTMINQTGAYNITYSGWTFVSGSGVRNNQVDWWYGKSSGDVWWYQFYTNGAPPVLNSATPTGNYALRFYSWAPSQSFYVQNNCSLTAGAYVLTFYSIYGAYPGGANGSTTGSILVSFNGNVAQTYKYSDPDTYVNRTWKLHRFFFVVPPGQTATYIRWTPNELVSATLTFRWAIAGISVVKYNGQQFQDATAITTIGGSLSYLENPYLKNPVALDSLTCQGIPQFNLATGASNLIINTGFTNSNNAVANIAIGYGIVSNSTTMNTNVLVGHNVGSSTLLSECVQMGQTISNSYYRDVLIGNFLRSNDNYTEDPITKVKTYFYSLQNIYNEVVPCGSNVVIGNFIGIDTGAQRATTTGVGMRCVAIGTEQYSRYNGFLKLSFQPAESVSIGFRALNKVWDNYNTAVGCYSLRYIDGNNNNADDGSGYTRTTQFNTALGHSSGYTPRNANKCTFIGAFADMSGNTTETTLCQFSTALGYGAKVRGSYSTAIGADVYCDISNCVKIGRSNDLVNIDGSLNVAGNTTFTSLPTCSAVVNSSNQLVNKTYVDTGLATKQATGNYAVLTDVSNTFLNENYFKGGIYAGHTQTINFGSNAPTMSGANIQANSIPDSALTTNIPKKNSNSTFSGSNIFNNPIRNGSSMPLKGSTYLNNTTTKTYVLSTSTWTENYVLKPTSTSTNEMYNITLPVITADMVGAHIIMSYQPFGITTTLTQYTTIQCTTTGMYFPEIQSNNTFNSIQTFWSPGPTGGGQTNPVYYTIYFTAVENDIGSYIWVATHSNYFNMMNNTWAYPQTFTSGITSNGAITATAGITASAAQTITFGTNAVPMGICQPTGVRIFGTGTYNLSNGIMLNQTDQYRKLVLHPVSGNDFQNYSIGVKNANNEMMFLVPDNAKSFKFGYATSTTAKTDVLTIDQNGITTASVKNVGAALTLSTTTSGDITLSPAGASVNVNKKLVMNDVAPMGGGTGLVFAAGWTNGQVYYSSSVRAIKTNITEIPDDDEIYNLETFMRLKPSLYYPKEGYGNHNHRCIGFIAEEINELGLKELNSFKNPEMTELAGVHYDYFSAYLVKAVQLQQKIINKQQQQIDDLISILKSKNII